MSYRETCTICEGSFVINYFPQTPFVCSTCQFRRAATPQAPARPAARAEPGSMTTEQITASVRATVRQQIESTDAGRRLLAHDPNAVALLERNIVGNVVMTICAELGIED